MKRWSKKEKDILRKNYGEEKKDIQELLPDRSLEAIRNKAQRMGIAEEAPKDWTTEEVKILKEKYRKGKKKEILEALSERSLSGIKTKAQELGIQRVAKEAEAALKNLELDKEEAAYLAGVIDCDGSITIYKSKNTRSGSDFHLKPEIKVSNNSKSLIDFVENKTGTSQTTQDNRSGCYHLSIEGKSCLPVAKEIKPYLTAKKEQCKCLIQWCQSRLERTNRYGKYSDKEIEIYNKIQDLNS